MTANIALLAARVLLSAIFILSGIQKFGDIAGTAGYIESVGLPASSLLAWLAAIFETVAGVSLLAGFHTTFFALLLAGFSLFTGFVFHFAPADQMQMIMFLKNLSISGGFLALAAAGSGRIAVDTLNPIARPVPAK